MELQTTTTAPKTEDFTPLSEHQQQTPTAFFGATPVLHLHSPNVQISFSTRDLAAQPAFKGLAPDRLDEITEENGEDAAQAENVVSAAGIDIWVTSKQLTLFSPKNEYGVHIPYQAIVVHAAEGDEVLLGLNLSEKDTPDEDMTFVQLRITPQTSTKHPTHSSVEAGPNGTTTTAQPDIALFSAISACQELNPDPPESEDEDGGGFDETAPGATGWITSENMADFLDENGEFKMPDGMAVVGDEGADGLGEGAGRRRAADEVDGEGEEEAKWQRIG